MRPLLGGTWRVQNKQNIFVVDIEHRHRYERSTKTQFFGLFYCPCEILRQSTLSTFIFLIKIEFQFFFIYLAISIHWSCFHHIYRCTEHITSCTNVVHFILLDAVNVGCGYTVWNAGGLVYTFVRCKSLP